MTVLLWLWAFGGLAGRLLAVVKLRVLFSPRWRLDPSDDARPVGTSISVCVPARDEAAVIGRLLASLDAQDLDAVEVIVVDDRSTDGTGDIARRHRCRVIEGTDPPDGWLGKNWALKQAVDAATGDILLFVDADTWHAPGACRRVVEVMEELRVDVVVVLGGQRVESWAERLVQPFFWSLLLSLFDPARAEDPRWPDDAMGNGQFAAFRREAYLRAGGHEAVRDRIVEDVALVREVKRKGGRYAVRVGPSLTATHMYRGLGQLWRGFKKNAAVVDPDRKALSVALTSVALALVFQAELWPWAVAAAQLYAWAGGLVPSIGMVGNPDNPSISWVHPAREGAFGLPVLLGAVAQLAAIFAGRFLVYRHLCDRSSGATLSRHPLVYLLQPLGAVIGMAAMLASLITQLRGTTEWKGRRVRARSL